MAAQVLNERYRLATIIGEGGMATVYKAMDLRLERWVAVKVLRPQGGLAADEANAFLEEARTIARINHPNILALYDAGVSEGRPFLVMELLMGPSLRQRLRTGALEIEEAIRIAGEVAAAMEAAHAQGVLHRDVKPENILFGDAGEAKLADFGISGRLGDSALQEDGTLLGTPPYLAPEYLAGKRLDARADVYALGVVLYEMLTGQQPEGTSPFPPSSFRPATPSWLNQVVLTALAADPAARIKSALEFAASLKGPVLLGDTGSSAWMVHPMRAEVPTHVAPSVAAADSIWRQRLVRAFLPLLLPVILGMALVGTLGTGEDNISDPSASASNGEQGVLDIIAPSQTATAARTTQAVPVAIPTATLQRDASPSPTVVVEVVALTPTPTTTKSPVIPTPTSTNTPIPPTYTATSTATVTMPLQEDMDEDEEDDEDNGDDGDEENEGEGGEEDDDDEDEDEKEEEQRERAAERAREERERGRDEGGRRGSNRGRDG